MKKNVLVYAEIIKGKHGLPQAGQMENYYQCWNTPGLRRQKLIPMTFSLVADDFGVKYVGK